MRLKQRYRLHSPSTMKESKGQKHTSQVALKGQNRTKTYKNALIYCYGKSIGIEREREREREISTTTHGLV